VAKTNKKQIKIMYILIGIGTLAAIAAVIGIVELLIKKYGHDE